MKDIIFQLEANKKVFEGLLEGIQKDQQLWRPAENKWCLLEIVCHLYDEERDDFRFRMKWCLEYPEEIPPTFDPKAWISERNYMEQDYEQMLSKLLAERESSISWLKSLETIDPTAGFLHPKLGRMTAHTFLINWLAHDYLHIRQILRYQFEFLKSKGEDLDYAGNW